MNILITGANGQLGQEIRHLIAENDSPLGGISPELLSANILATDVAGEDVVSLDITNGTEVDSFIRDNAINVVINCAAATNVDGCETDPGFARLLNEKGPENLAQACSNNGAVLCHVSTDYVFSGENPMPQTEDAICDPNTVYGKTKLAGENAVRELCPQHFIVRTAWLYGKYGKNFVYTMLNLGKEKDFIKVVDDQHGSPTNAADLAYEILSLINTENYGTYHCTGNGATTWNVFAQEIMNHAGLSCDVQGCSSAEWAAPAPRPAWSILDNKHLRDTIGDKMPSWDVSLNRFLSQLN